MHNTVKFLQQFYVHFDVNCNGAEIVKGDVECKKKLVQLLEELSLPKGLISLENVEEFSYNRNVGFIYMVHSKEKDRTERTFKKIKQVVSYASEVTAYVEKEKLKKISGVKTKELLIWFLIAEVYIEEGSKEKLRLRWTLVFPRAP
ncbi:uncharacterized protein LOC144573901 [Carex rostrata]